MQPNILELLEADRQEELDRYLEQLQQRTNAAVANYTRCEQSSVDGTQLENLQLRQQLSLIHSTLDQIDPTVSPDTQLVFKSLRAYDEDKI